MGGAIFFWGRGELKTEKFNLKIGTSCWWIFTDKFLYDLAAGDFQI